MPQIDLQHAFSPTTQGDRTPSDSVDQISQPRSAFRSFRTISLEKFALIRRLNAPGWANFLFVTVTFLGGLFCAFYFFNSVDSLRAAAARTREYIYPRPAEPAEQALLDLFRSGQAEQPENYRLSSDPTGNPFARTPGLFNPNSSFPRPSFGNANVNSPSAGSIPSPNSLLNGLDLLPPGGDALVQSLFQGAARTAAIDARRTVVVMTTPVSQSGQATSTDAKSTTKQISNRVTKSTIPANKLNGRATGQSTSSSSPLTGANPNSVSTIGRSTNNIGGQMLGTGRGAISSGMSGIRSGGGRISSGGGRR